MLSELFNQLELKSMTKV